MGTGDDVGGGEGEQLEHQPWQPAMASTEGDLLFSLVRKSRPRLNESSLVEE
jgi:hypothetical protein